MKIPRIVNALGYIDDDLIMGATGARLSNRNTWLKWGSLAAGVLLVLVIAVTLSPMLLSGDGPRPPFDGEIVMEKYYDYAIIEEAFSSYMGANVIPADRVGNKLQDVAVTAGWKNREGDWISTEELSAEIYEIKGIGTAEAAALRFVEKGEAVTTTHYYVILPPNAEYNGTIFPDYKAENPVRYLEESDMGKCNGWQDFGLTGEIRTITVPVGSTYVYQMYSYYIRNDLSTIYSAESLPDAIEDLPEWLSDTVTVGRRSFWYSMGGRLPQTVTLKSTAVVSTENGTGTFLKAEYTVRIADGANEREEDWVIYFMEEDGTYSVFAVMANENFTFVKSYSESIVKSYQKKP